MDAKKHGYIKYSRKQFDGRDALWDDGTPFDSRSAWTWLIQKAAWKDGTYRVAGGKVPLKRGQFVASIRFLAQRFKWSKSKVSRFIDFLSTPDAKGQVYIIPVGQIAGHLAGHVAGQPVGHLGRVYTIVNYDTYQGDAENVGQHMGQLPGQMLGQQAGQSRRSISNKEEYSADFELLWKAYPRREGGSNKAGAFRCYLNHLKHGVSFEVMFEGVKRYAAKCLHDGTVGTRFVKDCKTFLGPDKHFLDEHSVEPKLVGVGNEGIPTEEEFRRMGIKLA